MDGVLSDDMGQEQKALKPIWAHGHVGVYCNIRSNHLVNWVHINITHHWIVAVNWSVCVRNIITVMWQLRFISKMQTRRSDKRQTRKRHLKQTAGLHYSSYFEILSLLLAPRGFCVCQGRWWSWVCVFWTSLGVSNPHLELMLVMVSPYNQTCLAITLKTLRC